MSTCVCSVLLYKYRARWIWHFRRCVHDQFEFQFDGNHLNFEYLLDFIKWKVASLIDHDRKFLSSQHDMMCLPLLCKVLFYFLKKTITRLNCIRIYVTKWPMAIGSKAIDNFSFLPIFLVLSCVESILSSSRPKHEEKSLRKLVT